MCWECIEGLLVLCADVPKITNVKYADLHFADFSDVSFPYTVAVKQATIYIKKAG